MFGIGMPELLVILVIILIIFGAGKLPEIGGAIGKGIKNFKKATREPEEIDATPENKKSNPSDNLGSGIRVLGGRRRRGCAMPVRPGGE